MELGIEGKFAIVTGAGRGLGQETATALLREGADVLMVSRNDITKDYAHHKTSGRAFFFQADLEEESEVSQLIQHINRQSMKPDILVNNLGGNLSMTDPLCPPHEFWAVMNLNLMAAVALNNALLPGMRARGWGRICHVSSISSLENQGVPSYSAAKAALNAYVRGVGRAVARDGVVMTGVLPGAVFTEGGYWDQKLTENADQVHAYIENRMAIGRFGEPAEISEIICFLVSRLSSFMTGTMVLADGGQGRVFFSGEGE